MVRITNGKEMHEVTKGVYENSFKNLGYELVEEEKAAKTDDSGEVVDEKTNDEKFINEMKETPISMWNKNDIKKFAELSGIDISETKNADEARQVISEFLK